MGWRFPNSEKAYLKDIFSEERFSEIQSELSDELSKIDQQIDQLQEDMDGLAWVRQEHANLKAASTELQGKVGALSRAQRKMLCGLFVDRVEIDRVDTPGKKREVTADVYFRLNLSRLTEGVPKVCTASGQSATGKKAPQSGSNSVDGGAGRRGYIAPEISARYAKVAERACSNGVWFGRVQTCWLEYPLAEHPTKARMVRLASISEH